MATSQPANKQEQGQVPEELDRLNEDIMGLASALDELEVKLRPVARQPEPTEKGASDSKVDITLVPVADRLREYSRKIRSMHDYVNDLTKRCEL